MYIERVRDTGTESRVARALAGLGCPPGPGGMRGLRGLGDLKTNQEVALKKPAVAQVIDAALAQVAQAASQIQGAQGTIQATGISSAVTDLLVVQNTVQQADLALKALKGQADGIPSTYGSFDASNAAWNQLDRLEQQAAPLAASVTGAGQRALSILQAAQGASARAQQVASAQQAQVQQVQQKQEVASETAAAGRARTAVMSALSRARFAASDGDFESALAELSGPSTLQAAITADMTGDIDTAVATITAQKKRATKEASAVASKAAADALAQGASQAQAAAAASAASAASAQAQQQADASRSAQLAREQAASQAGVSAQVETARIQAQTRSAELQAESSRQARIEAAERAERAEAAADRKARLQSEAESRKFASLEKLASGGSPFAPLIQIALLKQLGLDIGMPGKAGAQGPPGTAGMPGPAGPTYGAPRGGGEERF